MAILGFLHGVVLGLTSIQICNLFPLAATTEARDQVSARVRGIGQKHNKQFVDRISARSSEQIKRSIFGMIQCYNALPQHIVDEPTVSAFQKRFQLGIMARVKSGDHENWQHIFRDGRRYASLLRFQLFFCCEQ